MSPTRPRAAASAALVGLGLLTASLPAAAAEYRQITLQDGRVLVAEVLETLPTGLELRIHQGETTVAFDAIAQLESIEADVWEAQAPWTIVFVPPPRGIESLAPDLGAQIKAGVDRIPDTVRTAPQNLSTLDAAGRARFSACGFEAGCLQRHLDQSGADVALAVTVEEAASGRKVVVMGLYADAPRARREVSVTWRDDSAALDQPVAQAVQTALHLAATDAPVSVERAAPAVALERPSSEATDGQATATGPTDPAPTEPATTGTATTGTATSQPPVADAGPSPSALRAMSWVPVPGLPSAARGDWGGFAGSWALAGAGSAAMIYAGGQAGFTREQFLLTAIGGSYLFTVTANKAFGLRGLDAQVGAAPLPGGAAIAVGGTLGGSPERKSRR